MTVSVATTGAGGPLPVDDDELVACVSCGLCLPHCPTYRVSGLEIASPRGRIAAMRAVQAGAPLDPAFVNAMEECVQCRGCEAACPSSVPFGHLMEGARAALFARASSRSSGRRLLEWFAYRVVLTNHALLLALTRVLAVVQRCHLVPRRFALPSLTRRSLREPLVGDPAVGADAWLYPGCVMDAWMRDTHRAALRVMRATGASVAVTDANTAPCCGALHTHAGRIDEARALARRVMAAMPGDAPIVVDSAGCGAAMKDYGRLVGTDEARRFASRVRDFAEWVVERGVPATRPTGRTVVVQDPCHLRHVQKAHGSVRTVLSPYVEVAELDDDGLCCGAGGAYAVLHPQMAGALRDRKAAAIAATGATLVASANPGCVLHLAGAGLDVRHPLEIVEEVVGGR